jgi:23S rRNA-/tRNA-specific pseudouridylate synthase
MRLDIAVSRRFGLSRRAAREAVRSGRVDIEGSARDEPGADVPEDARLEYHPDRPARRRVRTRVSVLYEDPDLIVVDKPAGLLAVPTAEKEKDTLLSRVSLYLHHRYRRRPYVGVVHRLDRDTSGAVVFARSREALRFLQQLFRSHAIDREYLALVEGAPAPSGYFGSALVGDGASVRRRVARARRAGAPRRNAIPGARTFLRRLSRLDRARDRTNASDPNPFFGGGASRGRRPRLPAARSGAGRAPGAASDVARAESRVSPPAGIRFRPGRVADP